MNLDDMKLPETINVIQINGDDGLVSSLVTWPHDAAGLSAAEAHFRVVCKESTELTNCQIAECVEKGFAEVPGGAIVQIITSNNWSLAEGERAGQPPVNLIKPKTETVDGVLPAPAPATPTDP